MPSWQSASQIIGNIDLRLVPNTPDLRLAATTLAAETFGRTVLEQPALINIAALAISMRARLTRHIITPGAVRMVHETDLHTLPGEPPALLRGAWILEAKRPDEPLFAATANLAGYPLDGSVFLLGLDYPDGVKVAKWAPHWGERDLDSTIQHEEDSPLIDDVDAHREWAREAARFVLVLALHMGAEGSPVLVSEEGRRAAKAVHKQPGRQRRREADWVVRRIYLDRIVRSAKRSGESGSDVSGEAELQTRRTEVVPVRGHLKRQAYGPRASLRRWIYVEGYEARRWVSPKPLEVIVSTGK